MSTTTEEKVKHLMGLHRAIKEMNAVGDFDLMNDYLNDYLRDGTNHELRTLLVATKEFKHHSKVSSVIAAIVALLEERTGKKII